MTAADPPSAPPSLAQVVNKVLLRRKQVSGACSALDLVQREISVLDSLPRHPNLARLVEVIDDPTSDKLYLCLEFAGSPVGSGGATEDFLAGLLAQAAAGLDALHRIGITHGDLKAEHLLVSEEGRVRIVDFGSSSRYAVDARGNAAGPDGDRLTKSPGTPVYTAPECCTGEPYSGRKADVWALGIAMFRLR